MFMAPRVIAIDDDAAHLDGLANGLNRYGAGCLRIHFTGGDDNIRPCPHVRIIFADLHLSGGGASADHTKDFSVLGGLLEEAIQPSGAYFIVLWTMYPDQAAALQTNLEQRLKSVMKPFAVLPLDKSKHLQGGEIKDVPKFVEEITKLVGTVPQVAALLNWEENILGAAAETVGSILTMVEADGTGAARARELSRVLARLGIEGVGVKHVEKDRLHAVNEALLPIVADRIASLRSLSEDTAVWEGAFSPADLRAAFTMAEAAKLNRLIHIATPEGGAANARGAVIALSKRCSGTRFEKNFGLAEDRAVREEFLCKALSDEGICARWVLIQSQAACDFAQTKPGTLPFYLGLELPAELRRKNHKAPASLWESPPFELEGKVRLLHVSARFGVSLPHASIEKTKPLYRVREQLLADLTYNLHGHGARPGIVSFNEAKALQEPP